jgi:hypothetical protein
MKANKSRPAMDIKKSLHEMLSALYQIVTKRTMMRQQPMYKVSKKQSTINNCFSSGVHPKVIIKGVT